MRVVYLVILIILGVLISGVFVVDNRSVGISYHAKELKYYPSGIHWQIPILEDVVLIYTNIRGSKIQDLGPITLNNQQKFNCSSYVEWQVTNPGKYYKIVAKKADFSVRLKSVLNQELIKLAKNSNDLAKFNWQVNNINKLNFESLGIVVKKLMLTSYYNIENQAESTNAIRLRDFYLEAQEIKALTNQDHNAVYTALRKKNPSFFDYYFKLTSLESGIKNKSEMPSFNQLYLGATK